MKKLTNIGLLASTILLTGVMTFAQSATGTMTTIANTGTTMSTYKQDLQALQDTLKTDRAQLKTDKKAKNADAVKADKVKIMADLKAIAELKAKHMKIKVKEENKMKKNATSTSATN